MALARHLLWVSIGLLVSLVLPLRYARAEESKEKTIMSKPHLVITEGEGAYINFTYPFTGFRDLDFTNCFAGLYMYLENFAAEPRVLKGQQERLFFLFDTVSGRSATVRGWGNVPTAVYREIYDTDDMVDFVMGYTGYVYERHTDHLAEQIRTAIDRGMPVLARMKRDDTPYVDSNTFLGITGGDSFRIIVGYHGKQLRMAEPTGAQNPPREAPKLEDIACIYVVTRKATRRFTLLDGLRRIKRVMDRDRDAGVWDQYIHAFENYWGTSRNFPLDEYKALYARAAQGCMWNCHNFAASFRTHEYVEPEPEHYTNWIWDEFKDPRFQTTPTRLGRADDDPLRLAPRTLIDWACDQSHNRQWQIHALAESRDWAKKHNDTLEWAYCETEAQLLRQVKEYDGYIYEAVCAMIGILADTKPNEMVPLANFDVRVIYLPPMTVAASHATGDNCEGKASTALNKFVKESGLLKSKPDMRHFGFDCSNGQAGVGEASHGYEMWVSIPDDMTVPAPLIKRSFHGGLYAAHAIKMGDFNDWVMLREWVRNNGKYRHDYDAARWTPFEKGMDHGLEEQLNYINNVQNPNFDNADMQLDLLFPIREITPEDAK